MMGRGGHAELAALPLGIEQILPAFGHILGGNELLVIGGQGELIGQYHSAAVVLDRLRRDADFGVIIGLVQFF